MLFNTYGDIVLFICQQLFDNNVESVINLKIVLKLLFIGNR